MERCSVPNCMRPVWAIGMCSTHANRLYRTGTIEDGPRARASVEERFWKYVDKRGPNECWPWTGSGSNGYGTINVGGRGVSKQPAHRVSWQIHFGPIPEGSGPHGTVVRHKCDNRACVNPAHLELGTQGDNVRDMDERGGRRTFAHKGEKHHNARFTEADIRAIRASQLTNAELGRRYGCARQVIGLIRQRKSWNHIE